MKSRLLLVLFVVTTSLLSASVAQAEEESNGQGPLRKLGRGFANILFGIVELPNQYTKAVADHGGAAGLTYGLPKGIARWFQREAIGFYEVATFPFGMKRDYKPIMKPEFPNEEYEP